jgi:hypothetical protein
MGPIRNPRWEQKRTEGYVIVSNATICNIPKHLSNVTDAGSLSLVFIFFSVDLKGNVKGREYGMTDNCELSNKQSGFF